MQPPEEEQPQREICRGLSLARRRLQNVRAMLARTSLDAMGRTAPNPSVGAALLAPFHDPADRAPTSGDDGPGLRWKLFGGATEPAGGRHAEVVALDAAESFFTQSGQKMPETGCTLFVTLEPCSHHGRTPPCTERILRHPGIERIVIYSRDASLGESGIEQLRRAGRRVVLRNARDFPVDAAFLAGFRMRASEGRGPRLHLKAALTADDGMGLERGGRLAISGPAGLACGHLLRARFDAVVVGPGTIASDLPALDLRRPLEEALERLEAAAVPRSGRDLFLERLFAEARDRFPSRERLAEYQPERVFLLGRYFPDWAAFQRTQEYAAQKSGRPPRYFGLGRAAGQWRRFVDLEGSLPDLTSPSFAQEFRAALAGCGWNEVLIEGGAGLHAALGASLEPEDRIYLLRSKREFEELLQRHRSAAGAGGQGGSGAQQGVGTLAGIGAMLGLGRSAPGGQVAAPEFFGRLRECASFDLGDDRLYLCKV